MTVLVRGLLCNVTRIQQRVCLQVGEIKKCFPMCVYIVNVTYNTGMLVKCFVYDETTVRRVHLRYRTCVR